MSHVQAAIDAIALMDNQRTFVSRRYPDGTHVKLILDGYATDPDEVRVLAANGGRLRVRFNGQDHKTQLTGSEALYWLTELGG